MKLTHSFLKQILLGVTGTQTEKIGCDDCWDVVDCYAELELAGKDAALAMPLVEDHLMRCGVCREEYTALLEALKNLPE